MALLCGCRAIPTSLAQPPKNLVGAQRCTGVFGLGDAQLIVNVIPSETDLERTLYVVRDGRLVVSDGGKFSLDVNEFDATN
jgi:hypothetical protein